MGLFLYYMPYGHEILRTSTRISAGSGNRLRKPSSSNLKVGSTTVALGPPASLHVIGLYRTRLWIFGHHRPSYARKILHSHPITGSFDVRRRRPSFLFMRQSVFIAKAV